MSMALARLGWTTLMSSTLNWSPGGQFERIIPPFLKSVNNHCISCYHPDVFDPARQHSFLLSNLSCIRVSLQGWLPLRMWDSITCRTWRSRNPRCFLCQGCIRFAEEHCPEMMREAHDYGFQSFRTLFEADRIENWFNHQGQLRSEEALLGGR